MRLIQLLVLTSACAASTLHKRKCSPKYLNADVDTGTDEKGDTTGGEDHVTPEVPVAPEEPEVPEEPVTPTPPKQRKQINK
jgi:hypothetical protein